MENAKKISFETPQVFVLSEIQIDILHAVAEQKSCHIGDVVQTLHPAHSESSVRSGVHMLLSRGCLDGGNSSSRLVLRLTSRGRILLCPGNDR